MRTLALRLIAEEHRLGDASGSALPAAFRVCSKLQALLSTLVGARGYRTLLLRALTLEAAETAWLARLEVDAKGALVFSPDLQRDVEPKEMAQGGTALVARLLQLLETLLGEGLTLRLVQQVWPAATLGDKL